jgi:hypothetical protein
VFGSTVNCEKVAVSYEKATTEFLGAARTG